MTIVDWDKMRTRDVEDDKVFGTWVRAGTWRSRMAELITISEIWKCVPTEKFTVPLLRNNINNK